MRVGLRRFVLRCLCSRGLSSSPMGSTSRAFTFDCARGPHKGVPAAIFEVVRKRCNLLGFSSFGSRGLTPSFSNTLVPRPHPVF
jgi:hypothetical protein